jgi:hypothetical protein
MHLKERMGEHGLDSSGSVQEQVICISGHGNEVLVSIRLGISCLADELLDSQ